MPAGPTYVMFDFFGTLVDYNPSRTAQGFHGSHETLRRMGADLTYERFLARWSEMAAGFDQRSEADGREFSMTELGGAFLAEVVPHEPGSADVELFVDQYLAEWNAGVSYPQGVPELVVGLASEYRLAVVSNTHHPSLVPDHLAAMAVADSFEMVVTSVEVGWRKPHPGIYATALARAGVDPTSVVFVGDSFGPDYRGPTRAGMAAYLIDPDHQAPVAPQRRIGSVLDLPARLLADGADQAGSIGECPW